MLALVVLPPLQARAGDAAAGRTKAARCTTCHGAAGMSTMPGAPNLAGQVEMYLQDQLTAFRSGRRSHQIMNVIARDLSDGDIADLSAWFASIPIRVEPPP